MSAIVQCYLSQLKRKFQLTFKRNTLLCLLLGLAACLLLMSVAYIVSELLGPIIEMMHESNDEVMIENFMRSLSFAVSILAFVTHAAFVLVGNSTQNQYDKMLRNYQVSILHRNLFFALKHILFVILIALILSSVLFLPSILIKNYDVIALIVMMVVQIVFFSVVLESVNRLLLILFGTLLNQFTYSFCAFMYFKWVYGSMEVWHLTSFSLEFVRFSVGIVQLAVLVALAILFFYVLSFEIHRESSNLQILRFRYLPNTLSFKTLKELGRHQEALLNSVFLVVLVLGLRVFKQDILRHTALKDFLLMMPCMQAIYTYSSLDDTLTLLKAVKVSALKVFLSSSFAAYLIVLFHLLIVVPLLNREVVDLLPLVPQILFTSHFLMLLGLYFPLHKNHSSSNSMMVVVLVLGCIPAFIVFNELKTSYEFISTLQPLLLMTLLVVIIGMTVSKLHGKLSGT